MPGDTAVSVDRDFARFGAKSYAINKINTVEVKAEKPHSQNAVFGWGLLAVICLFGFAGDANSGAGAMVFAVVLFALFAFLAYRAWKRSKIVEYQLLLVTSSQAVQAIKSEDGELVMRLRERIEQAMAGRLG